MKNTTLGIFALVAIIVIAGYFFLNSAKTNGNTITGNVVNEGDNTVQRIVISEKNLNYYPQTIKAKVNQPIEITLDDSVSGCLRSFTIRDLGIAKYLKTVSDTLDFTPTQKGTFTFTCSMGMGYGKLVVE